jgi:hypothetical protein
MISELLNILKSVPILPFASRGSKYWRNRRDPNSGWATPSDVLYNISDRYYDWTRRAPPGSVFSRNADGAFQGQHYVPERTFGNGAQHAKLKALQYQGQKRTKSQQKSNFGGQRKQQNWQRPNRQPLF